MDVEDERERLLARDAQWAKLASEGGDVDEILSYWTNDAVVIPAGMPSLIGRDALHAYVDGTVAYLLSTNEVVMNGPDGQRVTTRGRAVTVWQRDDQGQWHCAVDIWNDMPA